MRFNINLKRIIAVVVCTVLICLTAVTAPSDLGLVTDAEAKTVSQYQSELNKAKQESQKLKSELAALKKKNAPYEQQKATLDKAIASTQEEIDLYENQIKACEATIAESSKKLNEQKELFKKRLVAMYTSESSSLSVLLSAEDYGDYLAKAELVDTITRKDYELITGIVAAVGQLNEANELLLAAKAEIDAKKAELMKQFEEVNAIVTKYQKDMDAINSDIKQLQKEEAEIEAAIKKAQQQTNNHTQTDSNKNVITGTGSFTWPVPGYYTISSHFGWRWGRSHTGTDIASSNGTVYGARIVAIDSGTVILSRYYSGYGNCVIIDHGYINGVHYTSLYAHMKAASHLRVGDSVTKGSTVGYVGATGNVTGPHLHFEITKNGTKVNPMNYYN